MASNGNAASKKKAAKQAPGKNIALPKKHTASFYLDREHLPADFVEGVKEIEQELNMQVCLFIQNGSTRSIDYRTYKKFFSGRSQFPKGSPVAILIESPGGDAACAYKMAKLLINQCGEYVAVVPNYAKSAATLLSLGSSRIILGTFGELGPLDMQVSDADVELTTSALNHVQTLERLGAYSKRTLDEATMMLLTRTRKKISTVLPYAIDFTTSLVSPLMNNVDVIKYTEMSRILKVGEEYAIRLLVPKYGDSEARSIAEALVSNYPEHGFVIDNMEAASIGLQTELPAGKVAEAFTKILPYLEEVTAYGFVTEAP